MLTSQARPRLQSMRLKGDRAYLIVGGLKGLCGSFALNFARHGAKHLVVMGRSGFDDAASHTVIHNVQAEGCSIYLVQGDATSPEDVERAFEIAPVPVVGVLQGAMVVRVSLLLSMVY